MKTAFSSISELIPGKFLLITRRDDAWIEGPFADIQARLDRMMDIFKEYPGSTAIEINLRGSLSIRDMRHLGA